MRNVRLHGACCIPSLGHIPRHLPAYWCEGSHAVSRGILDAIVVGIAHVEDLDCIEDHDKKARCERHALNIAKELVKNAHSYSTMAAVAEMAAAEMGAASGSS